MTEKSCGTIPYTLKNGTVNYLLIKAKDDGFCGFPKGHMENNETEIETALRETYEETSLNVEINSDFRYETSYQMENGNTKVVVYFLAEYENQNPKRNEDFEDFEFLILPYEKAYNELTYKEAKDMLKSANDYLTK